MSRLGDLPPYGVHIQSWWKEQAMNPDHAMWYRIMALAFGSHRRNGHASFRVGEIASILHVTDRKVSDGIRDAKCWGVIDEAANFGQLVGSDLAGFQAAVRIWLSAIQAVSSLPASYLGILSDQPTSADAIRAAESSLAAKAQNRAGTFGRSWERVAALIVAVRDGVAVEDVHARVQWQDFSTRSEAALADATVKLYEAGLLSRSGALRRMGYTEDEILAERASRRAESLDTVGVSIDAAPPVNVAQRGAESQ